MREDGFWQSRPVRKILRDKWAMACLAIILCYIFVALLVQLGLVGSGYEERIGLKYLTPNTESWMHWLGTDRQGRSILARTLYSAKIAIGVGLTVATVSSVVGALLGCIAGYFGKRVDDFVVWLYSTVQSIPYLLLLIMLTYVAGKGLLGHLLGWSLPHGARRGHQAARGRVHPQRQGHGLWRLADHLPTHLA
jgi:peptide/nickel transport system permease protein